MAQSPEEQERLIPAQDFDRRYGVVEQAGWMGKSSGQQPPSLSALPVLLHFFLHSQVSSFSLCHHICPRATI
jgi:hypothetical protein